MRRQRASLRHEGKQVCSENDETTGELFTEQVSRGPSKKGLKERMDRHRVENRVPG